MGDSRAIIIGSLGMLLLLSACSSDMTTGATTGTAGGFGSGNAQEVAATIASSSLLDSGGGAFGSGIAWSDTTNQNAEATPGADSASASPILNAQCILTIDGDTPLQYTADQRWVQGAPMVQLVPRLSFLNINIAPLQDSGIVNFKNLTPNTYHMVVSDSSAGRPLMDNMTEDGDRKFHISMVGFFVSPVSMIRTELRQGNNPFPFKFDLYWDTQSFPCQQDPAVAGISTGSVDLRHQDGQFYSCEDEFTFKSRVFDPNNPNTEYRIVVYNTDSPLWYSSWHSPDSDGYVRIPWNGYESINTGPADNPDETQNPELPEGSYRYGIQFVQAVPAPSASSSFAPACWPDNASDPSQADLMAQYRDGGFIQNFYGESELAGFQLVHGTPTATTSSSPS